MSAAYRDRVDELFEAALERPAAERSAWLHGAAAGDAELVREVEELLAAHELADGVLDANVADVMRRLEPDDTRRIGVYRVVRELGRGGMGVVYLAERDDGQFRRRVAVKLLRGNPDAEELRSRFIAERQILASLDHPNISQLLDGGITDGRLPYLVMEYVEGLPITQYCERHRLTVAERLRLFQDVCAAVHHAHRNLIIHRDLKPSNILVTPTGQVKLLDFGIAKLLNPGLTHIGSPVTWESQRALTPEYASPEQLRGEPLSTTSDVYSLGVVLYELITGRRPHDAAAGTHQELATRICDEEPIKPSVASAQRALRGDVDAIVLMALRKEPSRRYGSADLLAQDIERYLEGLPVLAHKGSRAYYISKFVRRHRITVATAAVVAVSLITGAGVALQQTATARSERDRAQSALREAEEITAFLTSMFEANDPDNSRGQEATARDLLRRGLARVDDLRGQPLLQARMLDVIGRVHHSLGEYAQARALLEQALSIQEAQLGIDHPDVAQTLMHLAEALRYLSQYTEAQAVAQRALDIHMQAYGPMHPEVATSKLQVATMAVYLTDVKRSIALTREALAIREAALGRDHPDVAAALITLGMRLGSLGEYEEGEPYLRRAIAINRSIGPEHAELANALINLGYLLENLPARAAEAETLLRQALQMRRATLGVDHPLSNYALGDLLYFLVTQGRYQEALPLAEEFVETAKRIFGAENSRTAAVMVTYAEVLRQAGRLDEALEVARAALESRRRAFGTDNAAYASALSTLALIINQMGQPAEAEQLMLQTIAIRNKTSGGRESGLAAMTYAELSTIQLKAGRHAEAEQSVQNAFRIFDAIGVSTSHRNYQYLISKAVEFYQAVGNTAKADHFRRLIEADNPDNP
jgi:serine/threonine-protein kinase